MGAAAVTEMAGGTPKQSFDAAAIALKSMMGLVCDPVAGLVEVPCAKRNSTGSAIALVSADMALSGIVSVIPFDEVVMAMSKVGRTIPVSLRETAEGGVAATPTGRRLKQEIFEQ
jgi:L-serine dehydratase